MQLTPKEKAKELVESFYIPIKRFGWFVPNCDLFTYSKQRAIEKVNYFLDVIPNDMYYQNVLKSINNL